MGCINDKDVRDGDPREAPHDGVAARPGPHDGPPDTSAGITAETQSRDSPHDLEEVRVVPDEPGPSDAEARIFSKQERARAAAEAAAAAKEKAAEHNPGRPHDLPHGVDSRPDTQSMSGLGTQSNISEVDIEMLEIDIAEGTHPHTLVAIIANFEGDISVQAHAFKYLALGAYDNRDMMCREDLLRQLIATVQHALGLRAGSYVIDVASSRGGTPQPESRPRDGPPSRGRDGRRVSMLSLPEGIGSQPDAVTRVEFITHAFTCFSALCEDHAENQRLLVQHGLIPAIMRAIEVHADVEVDGIRLLSILTASPEAKEVFAEAGGGPFLLALMEQQPDNMTLQREGCRMITQLVTSRNPAVSNSFDLCVALTRLYTAKENHSGNATLSSIVAQSLQSIMTVYSGLVFVRGVKDGELRALCEAIRVFEGSSSLTGQFASLLTKLSKNHGECVFAEECVGALVRVMGAVTTSVHLFMTGAELLHDLCQQEDRIAHLIDVGSIHCLLTGLRFHPANQPLSVVSLTALTTLVPIAPDVFLDDGGVATIVENLKRSVSEDIHRLTVALLLQLLPLPAAAADVTHKTAVQAVVRSLALHPSIEETAQLLISLARDIDVAGRMGDAVITAVSAGRADLARQDGEGRPTSREGSARLLKRGSIESLNSTIKGREARPPVNHALLVCLLAELVKHEDNQKVSVEAQAVAYVLDIANRRKADRAVVEPAVAFFELTATTRAAVRVMRHGQGIMLLQYIARHHPDLAGTCNVVLDTMDEVLR